MPNSKKRRAKKRQEWVPSFHARNRKWRVTVPARLSGLIPPKRIDRYFDDQRDAEKFIADLLKDSKEHGRSVITAHEREWIATIRRELGDIDMLRQVLDHWHRTGAGVSSISGLEAVSEYQRWRFAEKLNPETKSSIKWRTDAFGEHFGNRPLHQITAGDLEKWLRKYNEGSGRWSMWKAVRPLFGHATRHKWITVNPADDIIAPEQSKPRREVYTAKQYEDLLYHAFCADDHTLWFYLVLAGSCFFRHQELVRRNGGQAVLEWSDILWDRGLIRVREGVAKSTRRKAGNERFVPIHKNVLEWLNQFRSAAVPETGRVIPCSVRHFRNLIGELNKKAEVPYIDNGLRKSAISYHLAAYPETGIGQLSLWAGNSEASCRQHYLKMLSEEDGKAWFDSPTNAFWRWHKESGLGELTPDQKEVYEAWLAEESARESEEKAMGESSKVIAMSAVA